MAKVRIENAEEEAEEEAGLGNFFFPRCRGKMQKEFKQRGTWSYLL